MNVFVNNMCEYLKDNMTMSYDKFERLYKLFCFDNFIHYDPCGLYRTVYKDDRFKLYDDEIEMMISVS